MSASEEMSRLDSLPTATLEKLFALAEASEAIMSLAESAEDILALLDDSGDNT